MLESAAQLLQGKVNCGSVQTDRLLLSSLIPRERYLCAELNAGAFTEIPNRYHVIFLSPIGPSFPGAEVLVAAGVEGGPGAGVG